MAISNTSIQIKRSSSTNIPSGLKAGELAYSFSSNTLFLGNTSGTGVVNIGGLLYTQTIDNATNNATALTLVKRDATGNASFNYITANIIGTISGAANAATYLQNPQNFSISGGDITASAVAFGGNNPVTLSASLNSVAGLSAGFYGGSTAIPVVQVAANGRIMSISNTSLSTSFTVSGNTGSGTQNTGGTLTFQGNGTGITTTVTGSGGSETVTFATDSTVARTNTASIGPQTISTDLTVAGNLIVTGTQTFVNTATVQTNDSLIKLAANNNLADVVDIGFYGGSNTGSSVAYHGLIREGSGGTSAGNFYLFKNLTTDPTGNTVNYASLTKASLIADLSLSTGLSLTTGVTGVLPVANGGTNNTSFNTGQITYFNGTSIVSLANTGTAATYGNAAYIPVVTTDGFGRVSSVTNTAIAIDTSQITSGTLGFSRGGTGSTSYTTGNLIAAGSTGFYSVANVTPVVTGSLGTSSTISSITFDAYGRITAYTGSSISGLTVSQGGTGVSSFTTNGIVYGGSSLGVTAAAGGGSDQTWSNQILTVTNAGVPVWTTTMDGGTF